MLENGEYDTEYSTDELFDNLDYIVLGVTDGTDEGIFYFMGVSYTNKLNFIGCFGVIYILGLDNKLPIFYWRSKREQIEDLVSATFAKKGLWPNFCCKLFSLQLFHYI